MRIPRALYDEMLAHARAEDPNECCGMVAARDGEAVRVYPVKNRFATSLRFEMDRQELYNAWKSIDDANMDVGILYHSHTRTEPYPSQTDINHAADWPGTLWLIFGLAADEPFARIYEIRDGEVLESPLQVE